jgi:hypothetical protein
MKLSDWASIAEIASGVAVVVTLIFLIVGIRENTAITRASAFDRNMESVNQFRLEIAKDPELTRIWQSQRELLSLNWVEQPQGSNGIDSTRAILLSGTLWGIYEKSYYAHQYGLIGTDEWARFELQMCSRMKDLGSEIWDRLARETLSPQFTEYARVLCSNSR